MSKTCAIRLEQACLTRRYPAILRRRAADSIAPRIPPALSKMANMRPKMAKTRFKMAKMRPKMAKMKPKIAKMRLKMG